MYPYDGISKFMLNVGALLPDYTISRCL